MKQLITIGKEDFADCFEIRRDVEYAKSKREYSEED